MLSISGSFGERRERDEVVLCHSDAGLSFNSPIAVAAKLPQAQPHPQEGTTSHHLLGE